MPESPLTAPELLREAHCLLSEARLSTAAMMDAARRSYAAAQEFAQARPDREADA